MQQQRWYCCVCTVLDAKRWTKAVSPCSMNLPTMNSWQDSAVNFMRAQSSVNQQQQQQQLSMQG